MEVKKLIYPAQCSLHQGRREVILLLWQTKWCKSSYVTLFAMKHLVFGGYVLFGVTVLFMMW